MKHLKRFESFESSPITQGLAVQADTYSKMDRLDSSKMIPKNYTGVLYYLPKKDEYYLQISNTENKPYIVRGVPSAPELFVKLEPTEYFTQEDLDNYSNLSKILTYGQGDQSGRWKDYTYKIYGYVLNSDLKTSGVEDVLHITGIEKI